MSKPTHPFTGPLPLLCIALLLTLVPSLAQAYVDPGAGAMLIQFAVGGVAGFIVILRLYWKKIKYTMFRSRVEKTNTPPQPKPPMRP